MSDRMKRFVRLGLFAAALTLVACGDTPSTTEEARGLLTGVPLVLALSVIVVVVAGALMVGAIGVDRLMQSRQALKEAEEADDEPDPDDDAEEMVAGIGVGRAPVPRWLYAFYVIIPLFAFTYVFNAADFSTAGGGDGPVHTPEPEGPVTEVTVVGQNIAFDLALLTFPSDTEVTITFDNDDNGVPHNLTVWTDEAAATTADDAGKIAETSTFNGVESEDLTYNTGAAGDYFFNCTIHPSMKGTVEVVDAEAAPAEGEAEAESEGDTHA